MTYNLLNGMLNPTILHACYERSIGSRQYEVRSIRSGQVIQSNSIGRWETIVGL